MPEEQSYKIDQILQEMRADYWNNLEAIDDAGGNQGAEFLIVRYGDQRYGLPAACCREVLKLPRLIRVPRLPEHLRGIFNLRGEIVAVTDLRPLLGHSAREIDDSCRLVVVESGAIKTALLVDTVETLRRIEDDMTETLAEGVGGGARDLISGKVVEEERCLFLLDLARLLNRPELIVEQKEPTHT